MLSIGNVRNVIKNNRKIKNMFDFIKYSFWPAIKVRAIYFWWIMKYRGKKNIPPELIFNQMQKNMEGLSKNLMDAFRAMPNDVPEDERKQMIEALQKVAGLDSEINNVIKESKLNQN